MEKGKMNRRQFLRMSAGLGGVALLAACAPKPTEPAKPAEATQAPAEATQAPEATTAPAEAVKIQIMWRTESTEQPMLEGMIADYKKKQSNVTMELITVPWAEYEPKLMSMYAGGIPPDIYGTGGTNPYVERSFRGMVLVLDPYVEKEGEDFKKDLWPVGLKSYTIGGKLIAMTFALLGPGVFYNATMFDEKGVKYPPTDWKVKWPWEEMLDTAKQLTLDKDGDGKIDQYGLNCGHASVWYYTRLWGQDVVGKDDYASGLLHKWQTDAKEVYDAAVAGVQARADTLLVQNIGPSPATAQALGQIGPLLKTGAVAMEFTGGWALWGDLPEKYKYRCGINPTGGVNGSGTNCRNCWCEPLQICSKTKYPDQSWGFVKYMTVDEDSLTIQLTHRNLLPAKRSLTDLYFQKYASRVAMTPEEQRAFFVGGLENAETTVPDHILVGWAAARDIMNAELDPVWQGTKTAKEAIDSMVPKINQKAIENLQQLGLS